MTGLDELHRDGWTAVPDVLSGAEAAALAARCAALLDAGAERAAGGDKASGGTRRAGDLASRLPGTEALLAHPALTEAVAALVGPGVALADLAYRCPQPGFGEQTAHCDDVPLERAGECRAATGIVALCDFTELNGATAVVPGSHRRPDLQRRAASLDLGADEVVLTGRAGTAFVFSAHLLHRGTRNRSSQPRPALQALWRRTR